MNSSRTSLICRFSSNPVFTNTSPRKRGDDYANESSRLLDLRDISLTTIQACVLLGAFSITRGESAAESVYYCAACRIANLLDLAHKPTMDGLEKEVNRRGILSPDAPKLSIARKRELTDMISVVVTLYDRRLVINRREPYTSNAAARGYSLSYGRYNVP